MLPIIIMTISLLLDGLLTNYLPFLVNDLSFFTPLFTLISIFIIYPLYRKKEKKYFISIFILGILYDLLYTNLLFFNAVLFVFIGFIIRLIIKNFELSYMKIILYIVIVVVSYETLTLFFLGIFNIIPVSINRLIYKITHSLLINIIYGEILFIIIKILPKKYKEISIN